MIYCSIIRDGITTFERTAAPLDHSCTTLCKYMLLTVQTLVAGTMRVNRQCSTVCTSCTATDPCFRNKHVSIRAEDSYIQGNNDT